jgi:hypothetical protein
LFDGAIGAALAFPFSGFRDKNKPLWIASDVPLKFLCGEKNYGFSPQRAQRTAEETIRARLCITS